MVTRNEDSEQKQQVAVREVEVNLSLLNDKLNYIISLVQKE